MFSLDIIYYFWFQSALNLRLAGIEDTAELLETQLTSEISNMSLEEALTLARAFSHFLNLMGIAETHHRLTIVDKHMLKRMKMFLSRYQKMKVCGYLEKFVCLKDCFYHLSKMFPVFRVRRVRNLPQLSRSCNDVFSNLLQSGVSPDELYDTVCKQVMLHCSTRCYSIIIFSIFLMKLVVSCNWKIEFKVKSFCLSTVWYLFSN